MDDPTSGSSIQDGVVKGKKYFECPDKFGTFVRPANVTCGDFPNELEELENELGEI